MTCRCMPMHRIAVVDRSDADLLAAAADGDGEAYGAFFRRHSRAMTAYAIRRCDNSDDVADLVSDTFMIALQASWSPARCRHSVSGLTSSTSGPVLRCHRTPTGREGSWPGTRPRLLPSSRSNTDMPFGVAVVDDNRLVVDSFYAATGPAGTALSELMRDSASGRDSHPST